MTHNTDLDRGRQLTPTRRAMAVAGAATLGFSLVLSIGPVLAAAGTLKVYDTATGLEVANNANVCSFFVAFHGSDPELVGTWELRNWPPTGDGTIVDSGSFDTSGDRSDVTGILTPPPGHYRAGWSISNDTKTFWVDADCDEEATTDPSTDAEPSTVSDSSGDPDPSADPSAIGDPSASGDPSGGPDPSGDPSASGDPSGEPDPSGDPSASGDPSGDPEPTGDVAPSTEGNPSSDPDPSGDPDPSNEPAPSDDEQAPSNEPAPSDDEQAPSNEPAPSDDVAQPGQDVEAGNPTGGSGPMLPDTALPVSESGVLATIGLLLILAAHAGTRRERQLPAA